MSINILPEAKKSNAATRVRHITNAIFNKKIHPFISPGFPAAEI
jgi:hypothetical protein